MIARCRPIKRGRNYPAQNSSQPNPASERARAPGRTFGLRKSIQFFSFASFGAKFSRFASERPTVRHDDDDDDDAVVVAVAIAVAVSAAPDHCLELASKV